jgi:hypothetical protein
MKRLKQTFIRWLVLAGLFLFLTGCASGQGAKLVNHSFNFDGWHDGWQPTVQLLEYSYGDKEVSVRRKAPEGDFLGYQSNVSGPMQVGDTLYVRWRLKSSGEVVDQRVDLRGKLPNDMTGHGLTFVIDGRQLYVFVVTPQESKPGPAQQTLRTWRSKYNVAFEVFPTLAPHKGGS